MPTRLRRPMRPARPWGVWPPETTKLPDTCRNRVARAIYDMGDWLGRHDRIALAEQTANYAGLMVLGGDILLQQQQNIVDKGASPHAHGSATQANAPFSFDVSMVDFAAIARPVGAALGAAIVMRCVVPTLVGAAALGARVLACSLVEVDKGPDVPRVARKLMRVYGALGSPSPSGPGASQSAEVAAPGKAPCTERGKKARQRSRGGPPARRGPPQGSAAPRRAAASIWLPVPAPPDRPAASLPPAPLPSLPSSSLPFSSLVPSSDAISPETGSLPHQPTAPCPIAVVAAPAMAPRSLSARARRRAEAATRGAAAVKPRGPIITGLSYDNRVVVEQAGELHWHARDTYPAERLHSIRPAPHKTVARAHRHTPAPELRQALRRALRTRQANGLRAQDIVDVLGRHGYHTYLVGGVVRDLLRCPDLALSCPDVDLATDAPTSEVQLLVERALESELPDLKVTSSHVAHYQGVISYQNIDVASIHVRGMFEPKRLNHATGVQVYPLSFGTCLPADAQNRDLTCNAVYYDPQHDLLLDPTTCGIADAQAGLLRAPSAALAMMNTTWALRYLKFVLRGYVPADVATTQLMAANAHKFFSAPRFAHALERIHEGDFATWCYDVAIVLAEMGCDDLAEQVCRAMAHAPG